MVVAMHTSLQCTPSTDCILMHIHIPIHNVHRPLQVLPGSEIKRSTKTAWDKEVQYEVDAKDRFVLRPDIKVRHYSDVD